RRPALRLLRRPIRLRGDGSLDPPRARRRFPAMKVLLLALLLAGAGPGSDELFALYARGQYDEAMREGAASGTAAGLAIAARAAMADATMRREPCLDCLKRGEDFARRAIAADRTMADGH